MTKKKEILGALLIPLGFALAPVFSVWKSNRVEISLSELIRPIPIVICMALFVSGIVVAALRRKTDGVHRATLLVSAFWLLFWGYAFLRDKAMPLAVLLWPDALFRETQWGVPLWWIVATGVLVGLGFVRRWLPAITQGLAVMSALLLVMALPWQGIPKGSMTRPEPTPTPQPQPQSRDSKDQRPDIYVIVLDGYARTDVLRTLYQCDNSAFLDGLKSRGFQVAAKSQANYVQTALALGALLRMDYWPPLEQQDAVTALVALAAQCPLEEYMAARHYRSIAYISSGPLTAGLLQETRFGTEDAPTRFNGLENLLLDISPLTIVPRGEDVQYANHRQRLRSVLRWIGEPPSAQDPYLVFCHVLLPHPPFVFGPNGEERTPPIPYSIGDATGYRGNGEEYGKAYSDQVKWIGPQILKAIDTMRAKSTRPAAILLMGDHGSRRYTDWKGAEHTYMPEAFGNLLAVYVPDEQKARFGTLPDNATPLPTFRRLLNATLNEKLPELPNHSYYSTLYKGFTFVDVTEAARAPVALEEAKRIHPDSGR